MSYAQIVNILDIESKPSGRNHFKPDGLMSFAQFSNILDIEPKLSGENHLQYMV